MAVTDLLVRLRLVHLLRRGPLAAGCLLHGRWRRSGLSGGGGEAVDEFRGDDHAAVVPFGGVFDARAIVGFEDGAGLVGKVVRREEWFGGGEDWGLDAGLADVRAGVGLGGDGFADERMGGADATLRLNFAEIGFERGLRFLQARDRERELGDALGLFGVGGIEGCQVIEKIFDGDAESADFTYEVFLDGIGRSPGGSDGVFAGGDSVSRGRAGREWFGARGGGRGRGLSQSWLPLVTRVA